MLNSEGETSQLPKSEAFCGKYDIKPIDHQNYVHGAFVGDEPKGFNQFRMQYIPHMAVLDREGRFLGNKVDVDDIDDTLSQSSD